MIHDDSHVITNEWADARRYRLRDELSHYWLSHQDLLATVASKYDIVWYLIFVI